jgi:hypothetical protein
MIPGEIVNCQVSGGQLDCNFEVPRADFISSPDATTCPAVSFNVRGSKLASGGSCACLFDKQPKGQSLCVSDANSSVQQARSPQGKGSILSSKCDNMAVHPGDTIDTSKVCSGGNYKITTERCRGSQAASFCQDCKTACKPEVNEWCYRPDELAASKAGPNMVLSKAGGTVQFGCASDCNSANLDKDTTSQCADGYVIVYNTHDNDGGYNFDCCMPSPGYDFSRVDKAGCTCAGYYVHCPEQSVPTVQSLLSRHNLHPSTSTGEPPLSLTTCEPIVH